MASSGGPVTLVVNDATRPPSRGMLAPVASLLEGRVRILFATGTHRPVTAPEREALVGGLFRHAPWESHDCDAPHLIDIGTTSRGTPVRLHPWVVDGPVLSVNSVEPHYFAGFTGGRKSFFPGLSSREGIVRNHYLACLPGALPGALDGNPVHLDMMEAVSLLEARSDILQCNGVLHLGRLVHLRIGDGASSFGEAARISAALAGIRTDRRSRVVAVHPGEPLDVSLYQAEKALFHCHRLVEDGGVLLLVSPCREGLGAPHLAEVFRASTDPGWPEPTEDTYVLGDHAVLRLREIRSRIRLALASALPRELVASLGIEPVDGVAPWLDAQGCPEPLFVPRGGFVLPRVEV